MTKLKSSQFAKSGLPSVAMSILFVGLCLLFSPMALAGEADVVGAKATQTAPDTWRFDVTVRHADTGWDHYANRWDVIGPDGIELGVRVLAHPHVNEQPFTRSLGGVKIPKDTPYVTIRANDSVDGLGGAGIRVPLQ